MMTSATDTFEQHIKLLASLGLENIQAGCRITRQHVIAALLCYRALGEQWRSAIADLEDGIRVSHHVAVLVDLYG